MITKEEIEILTADATSGDASAQYSIGRAYAKGDGVIQNYKKAFDWYLKSANQGVLAACYSVGYCYECGYGVLKDIHSAIEWYAKAAYKGSMESAYALGSIYEHGYIPSSEEDDRGVNTIFPDYDEAFYWYVRAYFYKDSSIKKAMCYELGIGTEKNLRKAVDCYRYLNTPQANQRLAKILESYDPASEHRLSNLPLLGLNSYRVLGIFANSSIREEKTNIAKIDAFRRVGRSVCFPTDDFLPCSTSQRVRFHNDVIESYKSEIKVLKIRNTESLNSEQRTVPRWMALREIDFYGRLIEREQVLLKDLESFEKRYPNHKEYVLRDEKQIAKAISDIETPERKILSALFWFHCYNEDDQKAFNLIEQGKWAEAQSIWKKSNTYSAHINRSVIDWYRREDLSALKCVLTVICQSDKRKAFLEALGFSADSYSAHDIKLILWESLLSEFPQTEREFEISELEKVLGGFAQQNSVFDDSDRQYITNRCLKDVMQPLKDLLAKAVCWGGSDFDAGCVSHEALYRDGVRAIRRILRLIGKSDLRYVKTCDDVALELLEFAIVYNNDSKKSDSAERAFMHAKWAKEIAVSEYLVNRCQKNIKIFEHNKRIAASDKIIEEINIAFGKLAGGLPSFNLAETMIKKAEFYLGKLRELKLENDQLYIDVSSTMANIILNVIIKAYNLTNRVFYTSVTLSLMEKVGGMLLSSEVRARLDENIGIVKRIEWDFHNSKNDLRDTPKKATKKPQDSQKADSESNKRVTKAKGILTVSFLVLIALILYFIIGFADMWIEKKSWLFWTAVVDILALFGCVIASWYHEGIPESQRTPFDWDREQEIAKRRWHKLLVTAASLVAIGLLWWYHCCYWNVDTNWNYVCFPLLLFLNVFVIAIWFMEAQRNPNHFEISTFVSEFGDLLSEDSPAGWLVMLFVYIPYYIIITPFFLASIIK